jgi:hypothetical protein
MVYRAWNSPSYHTFEFRFLNDKIIGLPDIGRHIRRCRHDPVRLLFSINSVPLRLRVWQGGLRGWKNLQG